MKNKEKKLQEEKFQNDNESLDQNKIDDSNDEQIKDLNEEVEGLKIKLENFQKENEDYKDKLLRKAAEFENYKRRTENDQLNLIKYAAESLIIKLLPVVDDFERSLQHMENTKDIESLKKGVRLIYDKLIKVLEEQNVKKIDSVGKPFDVNFHEAVMQQKDENAEPHTVLNEIEKGYLYKDRVIRHSKVIVSDESSGESSENSSSKEENSNSEEN